MCTYRTKYGSGSSPLARGLRGDLLLDHDGRGIIPARAGFTIWQTERQYNRTFATHQLRWVQEVEKGTHTVAYSTSGSYGVDPYWHFDGGVYPGTRFTVASLGATD